MNPLCCDDQNKRGLHTLEGKKVTDMKVSPPPPLFFYKGADGMQRREEGREMKDRGKPGRISI